MLGNYFTNLRNKNVYFDFSILHEKFLFLRRGKKENGVAITHQGCPEYFVVKSFFSHLLINTHRLIWKNAISIRCNSLIHFISTFYQLKCDNNLIIRIFCKKKKYFSLSLSGIPLKQFAKMSSSHFSLWSIPDG